MPLVWLMLVIILFSKKQWSYLFFKIIFFIMLIISLPLFINIINYPLSKGGDEYNKEDNVSAVLVLTGGSYKDLNGNWYSSSNSIKRAALGNSFARELDIPLIILGGSKNINEPAESLLVSKIINNNNVILEQESKNTYQAANNFKKILNNNNLNISDNYLIITSEIHNLRTFLTFKSKNYKVKVFDYKSKTGVSLVNIVPNAKSYTFFNNALYEYLGIIKYIFYGHIKLNIFGLFK